MRGAISDLDALRERPFAPAPLRAGLEAFVGALEMRPDRRREMRGAVASIVGVLEGAGGQTLQARWEEVERERWPRWAAGEDRLAPAKRWTWGTAALILSRAVGPGWTVLPQARLSQWLAWLPDGHELPGVLAELDAQAARAEWALGPEAKRRGALLGLRLVLHRGYRSLREIEEADLKAMPVGTQGIDVLDAVLCELGVLERTPQRGAQRRMRGWRLSAAELVSASRIPERFRAAHRLYLETYEQRVSDVYATIRNKHNALEHLWLFLADRHPEVQETAQVRREHLLAFIPHARERANAVRRRAPGAGDEERMTAHQWLIQIRCFFADICTWATEEGSPLAAYAPPAVPLERHDLRGLGFDKARRRQAKRQVAAILDLEREVPGIRALALRRWQEARAEADSPRGRSREVDAFWDWALLELLMQSGLRIEEACELTSLDVLRRHQPDGRLYYLLHVKPSKFDRARVIPIGDGLGRVIAEIIAQVKRFYGVEQVPACDHWDASEKRPRPRAPYLLQGVGHPSPIAMSGIRNRLAKLSRLAQAKRADGSELVVRPHDCRRLFASELLNNNVPVHVIQALLGHAHIDTVMVYAKLYPSNLVEEYRKTVRATYSDFHGSESLRAPTAEEWREFSVSCNLRDMGTHLCALPTGDHCSRGLVCLGCSHAQPKKSAEPIFGRMLQSHRASLTRARAHSEPAGQIAARELEITRIEGALRRAGDLTDDVAASLEAVA